MTWTDTEISLLKRLWKAGKTASFIQEKLNGRSRSAILGKISRLGLQGQGGLPADGGGTRKRASKPGTAAAKQKRKKVARAPSIKKPPIRTRLKSLQELSAGECRWPFGDVGDPGFGFCGQKASAGRPYCPDHGVKARKRRQPREIVIDV